MIKPYQENSSHQCTAKNVRCVSTESLPVSRRSAEALEIEPYLESLAQSLLVKTDSNPKTPINPRPENSAILAHKPPGVSNSGGSAAQVAAAIRARRAKNAEPEGRHPRSSLGKAKSLGTY